DRLLCNIRCYSRFPTICASDGKTYHGFCELTRARCRSKTNIKFVKYGKCPTCQVKEPIRCAVPACFFPSCPAYPKATCVSFCACKSEYYYRRRRVNCSPTTRTNPCNLKFCGKDGICKVVKGKAVCVSKGIQSKVIRNLNDFGLFCRTTEKACFQELA
ncbi:PREDICTED: agrin-like, partial [Paramuricea clavata]